MMGYGSGGGHWAMWVLFVIAMVIFWGAVVWVVVTPARYRRSAPASLHTPLHTSPSAGALGILDDRLARGRIDEEEYKRRRSLIEGTE